MLSLPPANEVCEGYVFTGVCLSTGEPARQGGMHAPQQIQRDTVNERAVRILLERILVRMMYLHPQLMERFQFFLYY